MERIRALAQQYSLPRLNELIRRFLYDQLNPGADVPGDAVPLALCPAFYSGSRLSVYHHAIATFYAPSELCNPNGMHHEIIRCNPRWFGGKPRYDTILVETDADAIGLDGMTVARMLVCVSFVHLGVKYDCAIVEWFERERLDHVDEATGMWIVKPELDHNHERAVGLIHIDTIVRACHLIHVYGITEIPRGFDYADSLDAFRRYYVNWYADYHSHEYLC